MNKNTTNAVTENIELLRSGSITSSLAGAYGHALRETRVTAMLGYLIAQEPERFCHFFRFEGRPLSVNLETRHAQDRSDIFMETTHGCGVIEAKVTKTDPLRQALKYPARWRVLLTDHIPSSRSKIHRDIYYVRWEELVELLRSLEASTKASTRFVSHDLITYLEEHHMSKKQESVEIYAREINNEETLNLFLKGQIYGCRYEKSSRLPDALYFAPHFGQRIAKTHPGVRVGISYIAKIERVEIVETWRDFLDVVKDERGKAWLNGHMDILKPIRQHWDWGVEKRSFLLLGTPRLAFNPPVLKENLQKGSGWLSKRFFSFDILFAAWGC